MLFCLFPVRVCKLLEWSVSFHLLPTVVSGLFVPHHLVCLVVVHLFALLFVLCHLLPTVLLGFLFFPLFCTSCSAVNAVSLHSLNWSASLSTVFVAAGQNHQFVLGHHQSPSVFFNSLGKPVILWLPSPVMSFSFSCVLTSTSTSCCAHESPTPMRHTGQKCQN